jgi:hypothetical protein
MAQGINKMDRGMSKMDLAMSDMVLRMSFFREMKQNAVSKIL